MIQPSLRLIAGVLVLMAAMATSALAGKRVALVIGNSAYTAVSKLPNPANDASAVAAAFRRMGFDQVTLKLDQGYRGLRLALREFSRTAAGADVAVLYYAGHGIEVAGQNYLIPVDAQLANASDVEFEAIGLNSAMSVLERAGKLKLVILDACRNNPFRAKMARSDTRRAIGRGLARVAPSGSDTLVAYAAREGTTAADGKNGHSPYTTALLTVMETPGLDVRLLFGQVRDNVRKATGNRQEPFTYGSLGGQGVFLKPPALPGTAPAVAAGQPAGGAGAETVFWSSVKDSNNPVLLEDYLRRFPGGMFSTIAKARLQQLKSKTASLVLPKSSLGTPPPVHDCDRLAGSPTDLDKVHAGTEFSDVLPREAIAACRSALERYPGTPRFQFELGRALHAKNDVAAAVRWYRKAASGGHGVAMNNLGIMYKEGLGVARNPASAVQWFRRAAVRGYASAMNNLGVMYENGVGVTLDNGEAARWYQMAAGKGASPAMHNIAAMYAQGKGVPKDLDRAAEFAFKALRAGYNVTLEEMTTNGKAWGKVFRINLQKRLKRAGYYKGPVNGNFGPATKRALRKLAGPS